MLDWTSLEENCLSCRGCGLCETRHHVVFGVGKRDADILFVGEEWTRDGIDFCGIEDETFELLHLELKNMVMAMKATKEAMNL